MSEQKILLSIDAMLDTTLATVFSMDEAAGERILENGYLIRNNNDMHILDSSIDQKEFMERFARRDMEVLKLSFATAVDSIE